MNLNLPSLAIVVPCYNEEEQLAVTFEALEQVLQRLQSAGKISDKSKIYYVDDGSVDGTWNVISERAQVNSRTVGIQLARNRGHQIALLAGLCSTVEDTIVSIDADLQDGPENIDHMIDHYLAGCEIVYGVRNDRTSDTYFKKLTAESYYHLMRIMGIDLVYNHADFRLMSRKALNALKDYGESNLFLRGLTREIGFPAAVVEYERRERLAGESKYPLSKMLSLAWEGITSFSSAPLRAITVLGFASSFLSLIILFWVLSVKLFTSNAVPGWTSILLPLLFVGSVQLLCLGIIGEYISKVYNEVKQRPKYHINRIVRTD